MTEAEAKTKWCPMARVDFGGEGAGSRNRLEQRRAGDSVPGGVLNANCLGSDCMAWCSGHKSGHGYCGLAGL